MKALPGLRGRFSRLSRLLTVAALALLVGKAGPGEADVEIGSFMVLLGTMDGRAEIRL